VNRQLEPPGRDGARHVAVEARGGDAFLIVQRGDGGRRCSPVVLPLRRLPGYAQRGHAVPLFDVMLPTCGATLAGTVVIPSGPFIRGGLGIPPSRDQAKFPHLLLERTVDLPEFRLDRTEVTNAAFKVFAGHAPLTGIRERAYPKSDELTFAARPLYPAAGVTWSEARAFCRFMGKDLATSDQWQKALRGGLRLPDGRENPAPRRNFPWGIDSTVDHPGLRGGPIVGPTPVGSTPIDVSPYGVVDLAGNTQEWVSTETNSDEEFRMTRGGNWGATVELEDFMAIENQRARGARFYTLGFRCAAEP
jgi:formylglycine-generating enzyme required for sulfatase activity